MAEGEPAEPTSVARGFLFADLRNYSAWVESHGDHAAATSCAPTATWCGVRSPSSTAQSSGTILVDDYRLGFGDSDTSRTMHVEYVGP
jgi:hypothetical protein